MSILLWWVPRDGGASCEVKFRGSRWREGAIGTDGRTMGPERRGRHPQDHDSLL